MLAQYSWLPNSDMTYNLAKMYIQEKLKLITWQISNAFLNLLILMGLKHIKSPMDYGISGYQLLVNTI